MVKTAIERFAAELRTRGHGPETQLGSVTAADVTLAADCIEFVRDMNTSIEALSRHNPLPVPAAAVRVVCASLDDNLAALDARIKEASDDPV